MLDKQKRNPDELVAAKPYGLRILHPCEEPTYAGDTSLPSISGRPISEKRSSTASQNALRWRHLLCAWASATICLLERLLAATVCAMARSHALRSAREGLQNSGGKRGPL